MIKVISISILSLFLINNGPNQNAKKEYSKTVWSEISVDDSSNYHLFKPYNKIHIGLNSPYDVELNNDKIHSQKNQIKWNLWSLIRYHSLQGNLTFYSPVNPESKSELDNGNLKFPITSDKYGSLENGNYFTDNKFKKIIDQSIFISTTIVDPYPIPLSDIYGYDSLDIEGNVVYPNTDEIYYHKDSDIISFKIKETKTYNSESELIESKIDAIQPIVTLKNHRDGSKFAELFWIDYQEIKPYLNETFFKINLTGSDKIISYLEFFEKRLYTSKIVEETEMKEIK